MKKGSCCSAKKKCSQDRGGLCDAFTAPIHRMAIPEGEERAVLKMDIHLFGCVYPGVRVRDIPDVVLARVLLGESLVEAYTRFGPQE